MVTILLLSAPVEIIILAPTLLEGAIRAQVLHRIR
jgi:hypothetical protein